MTRYGYPAMNTTLREEGVRTNRGMRQATLEERHAASGGDRGPVGEDADGT